VIRSPAPHPAPDEKESVRSFERFFRGEYRRLAKALYVLTGDPDVADELAQEALVRVYERWDRVQAMASPVGYLYRVALNLNRSRLRRIVMGTRRLIAPRREPDPLLAVEMRDELERILSELSSGQREALVLVEWLGLGVDEAARIMRIKPGAVRTRLSRARESLQKLREDQ
jgi:RNA polymerase sigma-70 factor (ECF subfamily)